MITDQDSSSGPLGASRREHWFLSRLKDHRIIVDAGLTTLEERRAAARKGILDAGIAMVIVCRGKSGKPLAYRDVFPGVYGEPLESDAP